MDGDEGDEGVGDNEDNVEGVSTPVCTPASAPTGTVREERSGTAALALTCSSA